MVGFGGIPKTFSRGALISPNLNITRTKSIVALRSQIAPAMHRVFLIFVFFVAKVPQVTV